MSNPIKFRVWSKTESKWMSNIVLSAEGTPILLYSEKKGKKIVHHVYLIDNYQPVVQSWTGFTDKAGRDIYEGDILRIAGEVTSQTTFVIEGDEVTGNIFEKAAPPVLTEQPITEQSTTEEAK